MTGENLKLAISAKQLRTGSASHLSRSARGMDRCPSADIVHNFNPGRTGSRMSETSGSGENFGCIAPTKPRPVFHSFCTNGSMLPKEKKNIWSQKKHSSRSLSFTWVTEYWKASGLCASLKQAKWHWSWSSIIKSQTTSQGKHNAWTHMMNPRQLHKHMHHHCVKYNYEYIYICVCVCMYVCMYLCMYVCMFVCLSVCMYVCLSVCLYVCMYDTELCRLQKECNIKHILFCYFHIIHQQFEKHQIWYKLWESMKCGMCVEKKHMWKVLGFGFIGFGG